IVLLRIKDEARNRRGVAENFLFSGGSSRPIWLFGRGRQGNGAQVEQRAAHRALSAKGDALDAAGNCDLADVRLLVSAPIAAGRRDVAFEGLAGDAQLKFISRRPGSRSIVEINIVSVAFMQVRGPDDTIVISVPH